MDSLPENRANLSPGLKPQTPPETKHLPRLISDLPAAERRTEYESEQVQHHLRNNSALIKTGDLQG